MKVISVKIPVRDLKVIDFFVDAGDYATRSEFIRSAIRDKIKEETD